MKKATIILTLLFLTFKLSAQYSGKPSYGFRLGLSTTPTIGWMKPAQGKSEGIALGFSYGLLADFNFTANYSFSTGLNITTINGKSTEVNVMPYESLTDRMVQAVYRLKYKTQYLEIPLTVKLKTAAGEDIRWYGQFGLSNGFKLSSKLDYQVDGFKKDNDNISPYTNFYRAGLIIGGGAEIEIAKNTSLLAGLSFNNGFTSVKTKETNNVKNNYLALNLGVFF